MSARRPPSAVWTAAALLVAALALCGWRWIGRPRAHALRLSDGVEAYCRAGTVVAPAAGYPLPRLVRVDGDAFLVVPAAGGPLTVQTRLLTLTVEGAAALRVTAFDDRTGGEAEVLREASSRARPTRRRMRSPTGWAPVNSSW